MIAIAKIQTNMCIFLYGILKNICYTIFIRISLHTTHECVHAAHYKCMFQNDIQGKVRKEAGDLQNHIIFHVDVNSAFLSWSAVKRLKEQPGSVDLRTIPSAVGGDIKTRHGIITARSIPAKKYGIKTAMPVVQALELCPQLVLIKGDHECYREYSAAFIRILHAHANSVQQLSIDEAFLDMSDVPDPIRAAHALKDEIYETLGFTVNIGISTNKLLAKMASDFEKPNKVHTLFPEEIRIKMWPLDIGDLYGCGNKTAEKLRRIGIHTIGDAAQMEVSLLCAALGPNSGNYIHEAANGISSNIVSEEREDSKSVSNEITTPEDIDNRSLDTAGIQLLHHLAHKVAGRLKKHGYYAGTIGFTVKCDDFKRRSIQRSLPDSTQDEEKIFSIAQELMTELLRGADYRKPAVHYGNGSAGPQNIGPELPPDCLFAKGLKVRLMCISAGNLDHGEYRQMTLEQFLAEAPAIQKETARLKAVSEKNIKLHAMTKALQSKFGKGVIMKGSDLHDHPGDVSDDC